MKDVDFSKIGLIALLFSLLFIAFGFFGLFYEVFWDAIVYDRYFASCFGLAGICLIISLVFAILELLNN